MLSLKPRESSTFSLDPATMREIFEHAKPLGHHEDQANKASRAPRSSA